MTGLRYTHEAGIARLTIANPPQNRLEDNVLAGLAEAVADLQSRDDTRAIVLTAEGPDFRQGAGISGWNDIDGPGIESWLAKTVELANAFEDLPYPTVVGVQGNCLGGALELALRCDIIIAAESARFGHPEATIGIFTLAGGIQRVAERVGRTRATEWAFTGEPFTASVAHSTGLVNHIASDDELAAATEAWVQRLAQGPTRSYADHKTLLRAWSDAGIAAADQLMPTMAAKTMLSEDAQGSLAGAIRAVREGQPRPAYPFKGR